MQCCFHRVVFNHLLHNGKIPCPQKQFVFDLRFSNILCNLKYQLFTNCLYRIPIQSVPLALPTAKNTSNWFEDPSTRCNTCHGKWNSRYSSSGLNRRYPEIYMSCLLENNCGGFSTVFSELWFIMNVLNIRPTILLSRVPLVLANTTLGLFD